MDLNLLWFLLLGVLLAGYAVLDGFDLGVGILHLSARDERERRTFINAIGPVWDGNEVWLVTFGGATFAAFPEAYATIFSGFYVLFMLVLLALIGRAVSLEFRSKVQSSIWRGAWDIVFFVSSLLATVLFGVGVGNAMIGVPLNARGVYQGGFFDLFNLYAVMVGLLAVALFAMHGAIYLYLKTEGDLQERIRTWSGRAFGFFLVLYLIVTIMTVVTVPRATGNLKNFPWAWAVIFVHVLAIANLARTIRQGSGGAAFLSSAATICSLVFLFGLALFPNLVTSHPNLEQSLTIFNAASSPKTLMILTIMAAIGMPFVLVYMGIVYKVFRGKVKVDKFSY